jgi:hypothetical protein
VGGRRPGAYRRSGADAPFGDPGRAHDVALEGYYWRFADPDSGRVVVALCGACRAPDGPWAMVTLAAYPGGFVRTRLVPAPWTDPAGLGLVAGTALQATPDRLRVDLGPDARLEVALRDRVGWPPGRAFGGLGPAQALPGLPQYWHPHLLAATVEGEARLGDATAGLGGALAYAEKNWGPGFPGEWWWGQAGGLGGGDAAVAFAGGRLGGRLAATALVVRAGDEVLRFAAPLAVVRARAGGGEWRLDARSARHTVHMQADASGPPHRLPVPDPAGRRVVERSRQHLAGRLRVVVRRGRRTLLRAETAFAGLEHGLPA